jgi:hypothetical protein
MLSERPRPKAGAAGRESARPGRGPASEGLLRLNCQRTARPLGSPETGSSGPGYFSFPDPIETTARSHNIFSLSCSPVKVTTRDDKEERQGEVTTRTDKEHLFRFSQRNDTTHAFATGGVPSSILACRGAPNRDRSGSFLKPPHPIFHLPVLNMMWL